ncbi:phosphotransferase [Patulibacter minatonensis]|uniref:phosphotransferase n=1 Tax=Patulibacter minatonensis TaxID=298163 RepID=UPI0004B77B56|nr:phosphotransferase [Patulibacter minatonensis]
MTTTTEPVVPLDAIDPGWLTATLRAAGTLREGSVTAVTHEPCGTGQLADSYRFHLSYDAAGAGPETLVGKFASVEETSRKFGQESGYYRTEIRFYQELASTLPVVVPTPVHAALAANEIDFVLLMEDMAPARIVDQIEGCSADEAAVVVEQAAALHAGSWRDDRLAATDWLGGTVASFAHVTDGFGALVASYPETYGDLIPEADVQEASRLVDHADAWKAVLAEPRCLWHSDLRGDNLLFDANGGEVPVAVLDWQGVGYGQGTIDLAYFLGTSLTTETRQAHERDLVRHYHEALVAGGVTDVDAEQCWNDYRLHAIHPLQTGIFGLGAVRRSERGDRLWRTWIARCAQQTRDLDSFALLAAR